MYAIICSAPINMNSERLLNELHDIGVKPIITASCIKAAMEVESDVDPMGTALVKAFEKACDHKINVYDKTDPPKT